MRILSKLALFMLVLRASAGAQELHYVQGSQTSVKPPLQATIDHFDVEDAIMRDGISELSLKNIEGLHLGFEEIIRDRIQDDPRALSAHFSLHSEGNSVRQILDALCQSDKRYAWSTDGASINVYPRASTDDPLYLLNLRIKRIQVNGIPDPDQGLTPLSKLFPEQQVGYFGPGLGNNTYAQPWTMVFEGLAVRQFINRMAEHMGPRTSWVWGGGKSERMFTFLKGGFQTPPAQRGTAPLEPLLDRPLTAPSGATRSIAAEIKRSSR